MTWQDERPAHGILLLKENELTCTCGEEMNLLKKEREMTKSKKYDLLLDRHAAHKKRMTK